MAGLSKVDAFRPWGFLMPKAKKRTSPARIEPKGPRIAFPLRLANRIEIACDGAPDPEIDGVHVVRLLMRGRLAPAEIREISDWLLGLLRANTPPDMWNVKRGAQTWKTPKAGPPIGVAPKPSSMRPI
jgi:hypothetical protein